jgi:hypothetical protein
MMNIGAVYWRTIALADVVSLFAAMKNINVPERKTPLKTEYLLKTNPDFI